jgi:hypothetical protein
MLSAQDETVPPEEIFKDQPPLTEAEALVGVEILAISATDAGPEVTGPIGERAGMDQRRVIYVTSKLMAAFMMSAINMTPQAVAEHFGSPLVIPTDEELVIANRHVEALKTLLDNDDDADTDTDTDKDKGK